MEPQHPLEPLELPGGAPVPPGLSARELAQGQHLLAKIVDFGHFLWELGVDIGPGRVVEVVESLPLVDVGDREAFRIFLKVGFVTRREHEPIFDQAFAYFWRSLRPGAAAVQMPEDAAHMRTMALPAGRRRQADEAETQKVMRPGDPVRHPFSRLQDALRQRPQREEDDDEAADRAGTFSADELLRRKDFEDFSWEEMQEARDLMSRFRWRLGERETRRLRPARRGERLDLRRTLRRSLRTGGEPVYLARRTVRMKPRPLVIICDISGSMSLYSRLLLHFIHTLSNRMHGTERVETFVFGTRLTRITRDLARRDVDAALRHVTRNVQDWSGGTRIGESLRTFNRMWARRVLTSGAVVLIISDGWDRGDVRILGEEMARLQRNCHRLIWLNPLLGNDEYRPVTAGMRAALPYVDDFLPANTLDSLFALGRTLEAVDDRRPIRRAMRPASASATGAAGAR